MIKILIIRFSSIGDIIQCMSIVGGIKEHYPDAEIHWVTRKDMAPILAMDKRIDRIREFDKDSGFRGLWNIAKELKKEHFDYIYDAHSNIRSNILKIRLRSYLCKGPVIVLRKKNRWKRFLLFNFGYNCFPKPFKGMVSFQKPLKKIGITTFTNTYQAWQFPADFPHRFDSLIDASTVTLVPSANWQMKRWPVKHWQQLIKLLPNHRFLILAGPRDTFCEAIRAVAPDRVENLAGKTNLLESCYIVHQSKLVISADTGFLHAADLFKIPAVALLGPTAFGRPTGESVQVLELPLACRPCTKDGHGKCKQKIYQKCMVEITPHFVAQHVAQLLS